MCGGSYRWRWERWRVATAAAGGGGDGWRWEGGGGGLPPLAATREAWGLGPARESTGVPAERTCGEGT